MENGEANVGIGKKQPWFPIHFHLVHDLRFKGLGYKPTVAFVDLISRLQEHLSLRRIGGRQGPYVMSDAKLAAVTDMSVKLFRQARKSWTTWGWIECEPGYMSNEGKFPTQYQDCKYATTFPGLRNAIMHRVVWQRLMASLFFKSLSHEDLTAAVWLTYLWEGFGGEEDPRVGVMLSDSDAELITGMPPRTLLGSLRKLRDTESSGFSFGLEHRHGNIEVRDLKRWNIYAEGGHALL